LYKYNNVGSTIAVRFQSDKAGSADYQTSKYDVDEDITFDCLSASHSVYQCEASEDKASKNSSRTIYNRRVMKQPLQPCMNLVSSTPPLNTGKSIFHACWYIALTYEL